MNTFAKRRFLILTFFLILFSTFSVKGQSKFPKPKYKAQSNGVPAAPYQIKLKQPDGSNLDVYLKGDGALHWNQTIDGYTLIKGQSGFYEYAIADSKGNLKSSGVRANNKSQRKPGELANIKKGVNYSKTQTKTSKSSYLKASANGPSKAFPTNGTRNLLVILIDFPDRTHTFPTENYDNMMNQQGYNGTGSFKDFYLANSFGQLDITSTVVGWYTATQNHDYYCNECLGADPNNTTRELVREAIDAAEADGVDFSIFDNDNDGEVDGIMVIHQGEGAEMGNTTNIWSNSWTLNPGGAYTNLSVSYDGVLIKDYTINPETRSGSMGTIGVLCHEFGHNLGLPDYYDTDYAESGGDSFDLGKWDCMAQGAHNNDGATPSNHNSYSRNLLGWQTSIELTSSATVTLNNSVQFNESYCYSTPTANEYFWIENRQPLSGSFDQFIPGHGMLIYHIDLNHGGWQDNTINVDPTHNAMDIEEADNIRSAGTLAGDPFPGTSNATSFTDITVVNSNTWLGEETNKPITSISENNGIITFDFMGGDANVPENFNASAISSSQIDLSWNLNSNNNPVMIAWSNDGVFGAPQNGVSYTNGSSVPGGGTVIYSGSSNSTQHNLLSSSTTYYYRIWSNLSNNYSSGITTTATTLCDVINSFPYSEDFESAKIPTCWSQNGYNVSWQFISGNGSSNPSNAQSGSYNACLKDFSTSSNRNKLISPAFDLTNVHSPTLDFWYTLEQRGYYSDELRIYYKTSSDDYWHYLKTFSFRTTEWTKETIGLPNPSSEYYIAFEGDALGGNGVCIDNISIEGCEPPLVQAKDIDFSKSGNNITVNWSRGSGDSVLVVVKADSPVDNFPERGRIYRADTRFGSGYEIGNENYVIYNGSDTSVTVTNIYYNVNYHFAVFEYNSSTLCYATPPLSGKNSLTCLSLRAPLTVNFEIGFPDCWYQEEGSAVWQSLEGNGLSNPTEARGGTYNVCLKDNSNSSNTNKLISSPINITSVSDPTLKFWHTQQAQSGNQDELRVYYKTNKNDTWHLLAEYTNNIVEWTMETIVLPDPSNTYYLAFEGNAKGGHGICIDDISISVGCEAPFTQASDFSISGLENGNSILHWNNGSGDNTIIVAKGDGSQVDAYPQDGKSYIHSLNYIFGQGEKIGTNNYVVYQGYLVADTTEQIYGLYANHDYNFALFSFNTSPQCYLSPPLTVDIKTPPCNPIEVPYSVNIGSSPPSCWSTEIGSPAWDYSDYSGYDDRYSVRLQDNTISDDRKMLISPPFDLTTIPDPNLIFWHTQRKGYSYGAQDELRIYYKTSESGEWNLLETYLDNIVNWTKEQIPLPNPSNEYYIGFEGNAKGGYGVWIDEIGIEDICIPPTTQASNFSVSNITGNSMRVEWTRGSGDSVIVIVRASYRTNVAPEIYTTYEANNTFGLGEEIGGGNYVVYNGSDNYVDINGLTSGIEYYYAIYEYNDASKCYLLTNPLRGNVSTICPIVTFPFVEDFEGAKISTCWSQEINGASWRVLGSAIYSSTSPHEGLNFAALTSSYSSYETKLISPSLDLTTLSSPTLKFWSITSGEELQVYYKTSATAPWNLLASYTNTTDWTREIISLPEPSEDYYIAFQGNVRGGSVYLDDISVYFDCDAPAIQASNIQTSNVTSTSMNIEWIRGSGNSVLVVAKADSEANVFPVDGVPYQASSEFGSGQEIGNGNFVIYNGTGSSLNLTGLSAGINYHLSIYEYDSTSNCYLNPPYREIVKSHCTPIPFNEGFESQMYLTCWSQEENPLVRWHFNSVEHVTAYEGFKYAMLGDLSLEPDINKLISPALNLSTLADPTLTFWHQQKRRCDNCQDELKIYYKTAESGAWNLLANYNANLDTWTKETIFLPNPTEDYYIAFEGNAKGGSGIKIDRLSVSSGCQPPSLQASNFRINNKTNNSMSIEWTRGNGNNVIVIARAGSPVNISPEIGMFYNANSEYSAGQEIGVGNFVVYNGNENSVNITGLSSGTYYHFAIYEYDGLSNCYLYNPLIGSATTDCNQISFPYSVGFENGELPDCWTQESGPPIWKIFEGVGSNSAYEGSYFAYMLHSPIPAEKNKMISPSFDMTSLSNPILSFWCKRFYLNQAPEELNIYYKTSSNDEWQLLRTYTIETQDWTMETINLPSPTNDYYIAFEGGNGNGNGISLDEITISEGCIPPSLQSTNFSSTNTNNNSFNIEWNRGNGSNVIVVARTGAPVNHPPVNGVTYSANPIFGSGDEIGSKNFVVYNGNGNSVNITGLNSGIDYHFAIYEFDNLSYCYLNPALRGKSRTTCGGTISLPYIENFSTWPPICWEFTGGNFWELHKTARNTFAKANFYNNYPRSGIMTTPEFNFSSTTTPELSFKWAHCFVNGMDRLRVEITNDGVNWTEIWNKAGSALESYNCSHNTPSVFKTERLNLIDYAGQESVKIRFIGSAGGDYDLYLDSIIVGQICEVPVISNVLDNSHCGYGEVSLEATADAGEINWYSNESGGTPLGTGNTFITPTLTETTTYYVDATDNGCTTDTRTAIIATINEIPEVTGTTNNSRCGTGSVTLGATASTGTINWYSAQAEGVALGTGNSFNTLELASSTTFYVDATENGCTTPTRTSVIATINPFPGKPSTPEGTATLCVNPENQIYSTENADNTANYIWEILPDNAGTINGSGISATVDFDNTFEGTVKIYVFGENDCGSGESSDSLDVVISPCTSVEEVDIENIVKIYPNPSDGKISIKFPDNNTISYFEIISQSGKVILVKNVSKSIEEVELKISGMYTFRFFNKGNFFSKNVIIRN